MMDFASFIRSIHEIEKLPVTVLQNGDSDSNLFIHYLRNWLKRAFRCEVFIRALPENSVQLLQGELETLFLGQQNIYLITHYANASRSAKDEFIRIMNGYNGPHTVFIIDQQKNASLVEKFRTITCASYPVELAQELLVNFFALEIARVRQFFSFRSATQRNSMNVSFLARLALYIPVVGNMPHFFVDWMPRLFEEQKSLFQLSDSVFLKDTKRFAMLWSQNKDDYGIPFWTAFFSEQFFKAALFVAEMNLGNHSTAKSIGTRLPFSFLKNGWKQHDFELLFTVHQEIVLFDAKFKIGETRAEEFEIILFRFLMDR